MTTSIPTKSSDVISSLTAAEMSIAERAAGLSITTLEDPDYPKVDLLAALGWVHAKREEPTLSFRDYKESRTLTQITEQLGLGDDEADAGDKPAADDDTPADAEGNGSTSSSTSKRSGSRRSASRPE